MKIRKWTLKNRGFTIVEVLIVLAIAGLIMLIVFLAIPYMQRAVRDNRRKSDLSAFYAAMTEYSSNRSKGKAPFFNFANPGNPLEQTDFDDFKQKLGPRFDDYKIELMGGGHGHSHWWQHETDHIVLYPLHFCPPYNDPSYSPSDPSHTFEWVAGDGNFTLHPTTGHPSFAWAVVTGLEAGNMYYCLDQGNIQD